MKQEALRILREDGAIVLNAKQNFLIGSPKNESLIKTLIEKLPEVKHQFFLLIHDISQLYDYVARIPEIAWDIVDFAEKPISVIYPQGKNVSEALLKEDGRIMIQLIKDENLQSLLRSWGKAVFAVALPDNIENPEVLPAPLHFLDLNKNFQKGKIMQLELNGEVRFFS